MYVNHLRTVYELEGNNFRFSLFILKLKLLKRCADFFYLF